MGSSALTGSMSSDGVTIKYWWRYNLTHINLFYEMLQINEFNQGEPELFERSVTVPEHPDPEVLQATTFGIGMSKSPRKATTIYTGRKVKTRTLKNPRRKWEKSECMNALECLWRAEEKEVQKGIRKIVHDLRIEKGMWEIDEKNLMTQIRMIKSKGWVTNIELIRRKT